jgi:fumarate hydratase class II
MAQDETVHQDEHRKPASSASLNRIEHDAFGAIEVPADRYWGAQTQRALGVFEVGEERFPVRLIRTFGLQKLAAVRANRQLSVVESHVADAIETAAREIWDGHFDDHFPLTVWQTGSGTQTNMNANEVIANRETSCSVSRSVRAAPCTRTITSIAHNPPTTASRP